MANQHDPRRGTVKETAKAVSSVASLASIALIAAPFIIVGILAYVFYRDLPDVRGTASKTIRTITGQEHKPDPTLSSEGRKVRAIAAGVAIDREGEKPECVAKVDDGLINAYIRMNDRNKNLPPEDLTTKSVIWLPGNWTYPWYWRDRPIDLIVSGREATVERLMPIVRERLKTGPGPGCADKILRAGFHLGGKLAGEGGARTQVSKLPEDPEWKATSCLTRFHCSQQ